MNFRPSFRGKLLLLTLAPLAIAQVVTLLAVMDTVEHDVDRRARESLEVGGNVVTQFLGSRSAQLGTSVEILAADFGLKQAAATSDAETIRSVLRNHSERVGADLALYLDMDEELIASTSAWDGGSHARSAEEVSNSLALQVAESTLTLGEEAFHIFSVPLKAPVQIGWVVLGFRIDEATISGIRDLTGLEVDVAFDAVRSPDVVYLSDGTDGEWLTLHVPFVGRLGDIDIVLRRSMQEAMLPYTQARAGLIAFGVLLLVFVAMGAAYLSGSAARPLRELTDAARRMISGSYDQVITVSTDDEFGELAQSFNAMRTAIAEREAQISHQALHDPVTDLPNRIKVTQLLDRLIEEDSARPVSVLCIRLLRMNAIASTLGHSAGDEVISLAARLLKANLHDDEVLGQAGTNEFVMVIPDSDLPNAQSSADRIESILGAGVTLGRVNITLQTEIGIAEFPAHGDNAATLLRNASIARGEAEARQERTMVYESGREDHHVRQLRIINDLRSALQKDQIFICYQPQISLPEGRPAGAEALVRWQHPELGLLMPDSFIPPAEEAGTIIHLTRYVLSKALDECHTWQEAGIDTGISVNLSARDLQDEYLPYFVLQELKDRRISAGKLTLEITENTVMHDVSHAINVLECLRDIGVRISIDDFGTGHSSLAQLRNIPLHELKIDKSFIMDLPGNKQDLAIVRTTIELAHSMGLHVVAEGVEDEDSIRQLSRAGCEQAQGYFIGKPMPADAILTWFRDYEPVCYEDRRREDRAFADSA
jgi:diguanylate cyclase (GGDEF)-like protein